MWGILAMASLAWMIPAGSLAVAAADVAAIGYGFIGLDNTSGFVDYGSSIGAPVAAIGYGLDNISG
jgi:hypothetical protein